MPTDPTEQMAGLIPLGVSAGLATKTFDHFFGTPKRIPQLVKRRPQRRSKRRR